MTSEGDISIHACHDVELEYAIAQMNVAYGRGYAIQEHTEFLKS